MLRTQQSSRRKWLKRILRLLRIVATAYLIILVLAMFFENFLVYPGASIPVSGNVENVDCEEIFFTSRDGTKLHGLYFEADSPIGYAVYAHGNGEVVSYTADRASHWRDLHQLSIFVFEYRGFGKSEGKPNEKGILEDADAAHHWLAEREKLQLQDIIIWGRSLGGGIAVDTASRNGAKALVLERTFTSLPDAAKHSYPFLPVRLVMKNRYESEKKIKNYDGPLLCSHGIRDWVVPYSLGKRLFEASPSKDKTFVEMPGIGHNAPDTPEYEQARMEFFRRVTSGDSATQKSTATE